MPIYRVGPQPGGPLYVPDMLNHREGHQAREASKCWMGRATEEDWPKRPSDHQLQEALEKTDRATVLVAEAVRIPAHLAPLGPCKPSSCATFTLKSHWGRTATAKTILRLHMQCHFGHVRLFETLWTIACQASLLGRGVICSSVHSGALSRQEYWSVLANTGCHTL